MVLCVVCENRGTRIVAPDLSPIVPEQKPLRAIAKLALWKHPYARRENPSPRGARNRLEERDAVREVS